MCGVGRDGEDGDDEGVDVVRLDGAGGEVGGLDGEGGEGEEELGQADCDSDFEAEGTGESPVFSCHGVGGVVAGQVDADVV